LICVLPSWQQSYNNDCIKEAITRLTRDNSERITVKQIAGFNSSLYPEFAHASVLKYEKCLPSEVDILQFLHVTLSMVEII